MEFAELNHLFLLPYLFFYRWSGQRNYRCRVASGHTDIVIFFYDIKDSISFILIPMILTNLYQLLDGKHLQSIYNQTKFF
ncbi:MAG: hypothetical protein FF85_00210 [alpha proteobacterium QL1]|nr:MAG: hypothetical protein FF85_00210 [alpha proteobacterium QL1]